MDQLWASDATDGRRLMQSNPYLSVVTSLFRSEPTVAEFVARADAAAAAITDNYEIILVNDGSPDRARDVVLALLPRYDRLRLIDLSRNFGQLAAIHAGLRAARGDYIFVLDSDLEEPPELLADFHARLLEFPTIDVVVGVQRVRQDPPLRALTSVVFYWLFERLTGIEDLKNVLILRIMTRRFLDAYLSLGDYHLFVSGLSHYAGFEKDRIIVDKTYKGTSGYSFRKRLMMAGDTILSFSTRPLYWLFFGSLVLAAVLVVMAIALVVARFTHPTYQVGWPSVIVSIWLIGAIMLNCVALIGLYVAKVFEQTKRRPLFVVRKEYSASEKV